MLTYNQQKSGLATSTARSWNLSQMWDVWDVPWSFLEDDAEDGDEDVNDDTDVGDAI